MARAADLLGPWVALLRQRVLLSRVIPSDDTSVPFLERGRERARDGHLWVHIGDRRHPYTVLDFTATPILHFARRPRYHASSSVSWRLSGLPPRTPDRAVRAAGRQAAAGATQALARGS